MEDLKLYGFWPSPYSARVIWALKLKGLNYDYIEEDISNKSQQLLHYNPIHKKVPVLVHGGKPISESTIILEYIEDTWPLNRPLLPADPYQISTARFWIQFGVDKVSIFGELFQATGEEKIEKAAKEVREVLRVLEEQLGLGGKKFFGGDSISLVDIVHGWMAHSFEAAQETVGLKHLEPTAFPLLHTWTQNFKQVPVVRENLPNIDELLVHVRRARNSLILATRSG